MRVINPSISCVCALLLFWLLGVEQAKGVIIGFVEQEVFLVKGSARALHVEITYGAGDPANDLFSYGVRAVPSGLGDAKLEGISVPGELDYLGLRSGALIDKSPGVMGVKGNAGVFQGPYAGSLLATYNFRFPSAGEFVLKLDLFRTLGPGEDVFLAGDATRLDDLITFRPVTIRVVARPKITISLLGNEARDARLIFPTARGWGYTLQFSEDLVAWRPLTTTAGDGDPFIYVHRGGAALSRGYYRVAMELKAP